jgi:periplasmic copper chaperone A
MKHKGILLFMVIALVAFSAFTALAQNDEDEAGACELVYLFDGWARSTTPGTPNGAVFGLLVNLGGQEDTLIGASTEVAEVVELHETVMGEGDVMQMRPLEGGFVVPPGGYLELMRGGLHIMLINLSEPLHAGDTLELLLEFERAGEIPIEVPVRDIMAMHAEPEEAVPMPEMEMPEMVMEWDEACRGVHVVDAWARATMPGMPTSAAYALLLNLTATDELLVSANTAAAEVVELHEMVVDEDDVMRMRPLEAGIVVPAGGAALLKPGGLHIMLIDLTTALEAGDTIEVMLNFAASGHVTVDVPVREPQAMPMGGMGDH